MLSAVRIDTGLLSQRLPEEERAKALSVRLLQVLSGLPAMAEPESRAAYQKAANMAEELYRCCRSSGDTQEEFLQGCGYTLRQIEQILEESCAEAVRRTPDIPG